MKRKRFTEEQIAFALRQAESGMTVEEICRKLSVSEPTFYRWKKQFVGMGVPHQQAGHVTAPDQCCINVRKFLPWCRPHVTQSGRRP